MPAPGIVAVHHNRRVARYIVCCILSTLAFNAHIYLWADGDSVLNPRGVIAGAIIAATFEVLIAIGRPTKRIHFIMLGILAPHVAIAVTVVLLFYIFLFLHAWWIFALLGIAMGNVAFISERRSSE